VQWIEAQVAMFARINNAFGVGKLCLWDGTPKVIICGVGERHYLGWRSSRSESSSV